MVNSYIARPIELLLVEDSPVDVMLTREALLDAKVINNLHVVENGDEALAYLRRSAPFTDAPRPDLVLLDLNLPRRNGHEVLQEMKADPALRSIPVVILTTSTNVQDVSVAHENQANCYISKPADLESLINIVRSIENFWLCVVALPETATSVG